MSEQLSHSAPDNADLIFIDSQRQGLFKNPDPISYVCNISWLILYLFIKRIMDKTLVLTIPEIVKQEDRNGDTHD